MSYNLVKIVELLSDEQYHDAISIGAQLNITEAILENAIQKLEAYDIPIKLVKGKGYFLEERLALLDPEKIKTFLKCQSIELEVLETIDSTNQHLKKTSNGNKKIMVCMAETQTQGRGRLNRKWHSPFGQNIILSILYPFQKDISELSGLSLVVGLAVTKAIDLSCVLAESLQVKWPNDIVINQKKMGGILIDVQAESQGGCQVIIGVGINVNMKNASKDQINQPWSSLRELNGEYLDRNPICAAVIDQILIYLKRFIELGLRDFIDEWQAKDSLFNQAVRLTCDKTHISGIGSGINDKGHLVLTLANNIKQAFTAGDTSILK